MDDNLYEEQRNVNILVYFQLLICLVLSQLFNSCIRKDNCSYPRETIAGCARKYNNKSIEWKQGIISFMIGR